MNPAGRGGAPAALRRGLLLAVLAWTQAVPAEPLDGVVRLTRERGAPGSGFVVHLEGDSAFVVTSAHVVAGGGKVAVEFRSRPREPYPATIVHMEGGDRRGLALLQVRGPLPPGVEALRLASTGPPAPPDPVFVMGVPEAIKSWAVIPSNVVSLSGRDLFLGAVVDVGNSGGPVVSGAEVVGLVYETGQFARAVRVESIALYVSGHGIAVASAPRPTLRDRLSDGTRGPEMMVVDAGRFQNALAVG